MTEPEDRPVYSGRTLKQKRTIERDVESLFTPTAFIPKPTWEEIKRLDFFHPSVKINRRTLFLSDKGVAALTRLTDLLCGIPALSEFVSKREISDQVLESYNGWLEKLLQPTGQEFVDGISNTSICSLS